MDEIKESHALITCPHCQKQIRVRARTLGDKTVSQALEETKPRRFFDTFDEIFKDLFGKSLRIKK